MYTGIIFLRDNSLGETICCCNSCDTEFVFDNVDKIKSLEEISTIYILCPNCLKRFDYFFWFEMCEKFW